MTAMFHTLTFFMANADRIAGIAFEGMNNFYIYPDKIYTGFVSTLIVTRL